MLVRLAVPGIAAVAPEPALCSRPLELAPHTQFPTLGGFRNNIIEVLRSGPNYR
jgi:hypothetical protein